MGEVDKNAVNLQPRLSATLANDEGEPTRGITIQMRESRWNHKTSLVMEKTNPETPGYMQP